MRPKGIGRMSTTQVAAARTEFLSGFFSTFVPDPEITLSQWADKYRRLDPKSSSEPGAWRTDRTPYLREIMDCLSVDSPVQEVVFSKGSQIGGTEAGNNWIGYIISEAPGPVLVVQPTVDIAKRYGGQRLTPMFRATPKLAGRVTEKRSRDSSNTQKMKDFPGGTLIIGGANSAAALRSMPIRYLFLDEVDAYPIDCEGEGSPVQLAVRRTNTFARRKIFICSTPTFENTSVIHAEYQASDQRKYFVPCPDCEHMHVLEWENFDIPRNDDGEKIARGCTMHCPDCGAVIREHQKTEMLARGEWRVTNPKLATEIRRGYSLSALYSPLGWLSWDAIAAEWIRAQGDPVRLKTFVNTILGEVWIDNADRADEADLVTRCESYKSSPLPEGVALITAGADVHPDRIEVEVVGWGVGEESWSLDYEVLWGDPEGAELWDRFDAYRAKTYRHPVGATLHIARTFIDSGGANTQAVYAYARKHARSGKLFAIKGRSDPNAAAVGRASKANIGKVPLFPLGTHVIKDSIYARLRITAPGPGYCHFPVGRTLAYFQGLTAEEVKITRFRGRMKREYVLRRGRRNEPLDCRVYAHAALLSLAGVSVDNIAKDIQARMLKKTKAKADQTSDRKKRRSPR